MNSSQQRDQMIVEETRRRIKMGAFWIALVPRPTVPDMASARNALPCTVKADPAFRFACARLLRLRSCALRLRGIRSFCSEPGGQNSQEARTLPPCSLCKSARHLSHASYLSYSAHRSRIGIMREFSTQNAEHQPASQADDARAMERTGHLWGSGSP